MKNVIQALRKGAVIRRGSFSGYWLVSPDSGKSRLKQSVVAELEENGTIERIDDRSSEVGAEWSLKKEKAS